jgi:glyoxylase-like metal-dependent hydrolase (beta-lactamase superfamily II)
MKKLLWLLLAVFVAANGAFLLTLTPEVLEAGPAPALTVPKASPPADMTLVAIEAGRMRTLEAQAYRGGSFSMRDFNMGGILVRHPRGALLFDTGFGREVEQHFRTAPALMRLTAVLKQETPVADQLKAAGIEPSSVRVFLTHAHWDHVSGIPDLGRAQVWLPQAELDFIRSGAKPAALIASFPDVNYRPYAFDGGPYLGYEHSFDVFGDGSVVIVPAPGHTPGSIVAFVNTPDGKRYALIGDIAWFADAIDIPAQRPIVSRWLVDRDAEANRAQIVRLHQIKSALPGLIVVPSHDRRVWDALPQLKTATAR